MTTTMTTTLPTTLLKGLRALDLTGPIGDSCGRILAGFGVEVIRVDSPAARSSVTAGELTRWRAGNLDKRSITLDIESDAGRELFMRLAADSQFVIESFTPGYLSRLRLDYAALSQLNPRIILVSISPFGQAGPYSQYKGGELIAAAMNGVLITLGDPDRPPVKEALDANCFHGSAAAALGAVMAHYHRQRTGVGQHVDLSIQEAGVSRNTNNVLLWQFDKRCVQRGGPFLRFGKASIRCVWKLSDGYTFYSMATGRFGAPANRALTTWMNELRYDNPMREVDWDRYDRATLDAEVRNTWEAAIARFFADRTKAQIASEGRRRGINAAVANEIADLLNDPQLDARGYLVETPWPQGNEPVRVPDYFVRSNNQSAAAHRVPDHPGQDNAAIYGGLLGLSAGDLDALAGRGTI